MLVRALLAAMVVTLPLVGCAPAAPALSADTSQSDTTAAVGAARQDPAAAFLLSAFFGLDNGLPVPANLRICRGAGGADGMPVIFATEVDPATMQAGDFRVVSAAGVVGAVACVTLAPAADPGELRTALLVGEFGSADGDPPVVVEIVGNLLSKDGSLNYRGAAIAVTPLDEGPALIVAETVPESQWKVGAAAGPWGSGSGCPATTTQAVRATWAGGVTLPGGGEAGEAERARYTVLVDGAPVVPFALADLGDGDNNHLLCLDVAGEPGEVAFPAGHLVDPNGDLNPATALAVTGAP